ncbi:lipopolysaccharide biosynthesis protein [Streptomyces sp. RKND-216]|nr:lipopolysaccharide biosynthesis protein [Streptomyces sp. RKND-216]
MLNTALSGVLGIAFWVLAARYYSDSAVGQGSALIAAMKFLAGLTALTLPGALQRFIPVAGHRTPRLVLGTYLVSALIVAAAATIFVITLGFWGPTYRLVDGGLPALAFLASVILWALLTLQDGVLTGLRSAVWVPAGNTVFLVAKMVLVVALASVFPVAGVFVSWAAAIALSVVPLTWLVFRRLIPRHVSATRKAVFPAPRQIGRFLAGDCTGSLFSLAVIYLLPVVVATQISSELNAYFYLAAVIGSSIDLLAINMGASLTVEGAHAPSRLAALCRASLRKMALIMVPISVLTVLFAPQILRVFGAEYADHATLLLRLMAVATLTRVLFEVYFAVLRVQNRTSRVALLQGSLCVLLLGSTVVLLGPFGITGAGYAQLASQTLIAAVACVGLARVLRPRPTPAPPAGPGSGRVSLTKAAAPPGTPSGAPRAATRRVRRRRWAWPVAVGWAMLGAALALYWLPLRGMTDASLDAMNGLGLVSVLPRTTLLGAFLLVVTFCCGLWLRTQHRGLLLGVLLATVVSLHAVPAVIEAFPRFSTAWEHAGFVEYVERTGSVAPEMDGRFTWPGFFVGVALLTRAGGISDLTPLMQWWPVAINLLYLVPVFLLLRAVRATWRAKWCAAWVFVLCGWVGQDYFSPQSVGFLAYLVFVAVLLLWFRSSPPDARKAGARVPGEARPRRARGTRAALLLALLIGLFAFTTVSHPLTPFIMLAAVTGLVLWKRSRLRGLPLLCLVIVATWTGFFVEPYWSGHPLFSSFGSLGGNITSSTSGRIEGGSSLHSMVLYCRVLLAASVMALAAYGWLRRRRRGISDRALVILFVMPFMGVWLQSYGGEIALRVFMFMLPAAAVLAGLAFFPRLSYRRRPWLGLLAALMAGLVLMGGFLVARWGNESYERVRPSEVAAMDHLARHDAPTARALWLDTDPPSVLSPNLPWRVTQDMEKTVYKPVVSPRVPEKAGPLVQGLEDAGPNSYLVLTRGSAKYLELTAGYPEHWYDRATAALDRRPDVTEVVDRRDASVYRLADPYSEPADQPQVGNTGLNVTWTVWSVLGGVVAAVLLVLLTTREFVRVLVPDRRRLRAMRVSLLAALPLVGLLAVAIVNRFLTLS